jgi:hypothetical protein
LAIPWPWSYAPIFSSIRSQVKNSISPGGIPVWKA